MGEFEQRNDDAVRLLERIVEQNDKALSPNQMTIEHPQERRAIAVKLAIDAAGHSLAGCTAADIVKAASTFEAYIAGRDAGAQE